MTSGSCHATMCTGMRTWTKQTYRRTILGQYSCVTRHTLHVTRHTSHVIRHTSHITRHTSHVTRHTSHVTRHTSHVTRHTSHVTHYCSALLYLSTWGEDFEGGELVFLGEHGEGGGHQVRLGFRVLGLGLGFRGGGGASGLARCTRLRCGCLGLPRVTRHASQVVQPLAGRLVTFTSGSENLHRVSC